MSPVADCNLREFLDVNPLPNEERSFLRTFFGCLAAALRYLHENRVRHKDIKPQNVLVKAHRVYLTDFGISVDWSDINRSTTTGLASKTTPRYCAPELIANEPRKSSADIWSLGCVFLEIWTVLCGHTLSDLNTHMTTVGSSSSLYHSNLSSIIDWCVKLKSDGRVVYAMSPFPWIESMLSLDPGQRCTAQELCDEIREVNLDPEIPFSFSGLCCIEDEDTAESVQSSTYEPNDSETTKQPKGLNEQSSPEASLQSGVARCSSSTPHRSSIYGSGQHLPPERPAESALTPPERLMSPQAMDRSSSLFAPHEFPPKAASFNPIDSDASCQNGIIVTDAIRSSVLLDTDESFSIDTSKLQATQKLKYDRGNRIESTDPSQDNHKVLDEQSDSSHKSNRIRQKLRSSEDPDRHETPHEPTASPSLNTGAVQYHRTMKENFFDWLRVRDIETEILPLHHLKAPQGLFDPHLEEMQAIRKVAIHFSTKENLSLRHISSKTARVLLWKEVIRMLDRLGVVCFVEGNALKCMYPRHILLRSFPEIKGAVMPDADMGKLMREQRAEVLNWWHTCLTQKPPGFFRRTWVDNGINLQIQMVQAGFTDLHYFHITYVGRNRPYFSSSLRRNRIWFKIIARAIDQGFLEMRQFD